LSVSLVRKNNKKSVIIHKTNLNNFYLFNKIIFIPIQIIVIISCYTQIKPPVAENQPKKSRLYTMDSLELEIKCYLIDIYNPGICFGMPTIRDDRVFRSIQDDEIWVSFIKSRFDIEKDSDIYIKTEQIKLIHLYAEEYGYRFSFSDGRCCEITSYTGNIYLEKNRIIRHELVSKKLRKVPC
jgi:hypothetical protein